MKTRTLTGRLLVALLMFGGAATGALARGLLVALLMFGGAATGALVSGLPVDAPAGTVNATGSRLTASAPRSSDALLSSGSTAATVLSAIEKRTPSSLFRRGTPAQARGLDTTLPLVVFRAAEPDAGLRHRLHLSRSGADGRHTGTPPPSAGH